MPWVEEYVQLSGEEGKRNKKGGMLTTTFPNSLPMYLPAPKFLE